MNDIRLLICDIDGTLVPKGQKPKPLTRRALEYCHEQGILLGLATGRPVDQRIINKFKDWDLDFDPDMLIGINGCEAWTSRDRTVRKFNLLPKEEVRKILDFMWDLDLNVVVFENGYDKVLARRRDWMIEESMNRNKSNVEYVDKERFCRNDVPKLEFHYDEKYEEEIYKLIAAHPSDNYVFTKSFTGTIEFMKPGIDKGVTLEMLCKEQNIPLSSVVACGDMDNDIPMLEKAGTSICLLNGSEATKKAADYITSKNVEDDGLGDFLINDFFKL
ncbi:MAG: HAD family hydrolase [Erysipelotrichaceae bacterium]|nr:HAD family hydrolase [Erysipelotrichaceae bacterium]